MKNKLITLMMVLLLMGIVVAAVVINNDRSLKIDQDKRNKAVELGIDVYDTYDEQRGSLTRRCLVSSSGYNLPCSDYMNSNRLDVWEKERIEGILSVEIKRSNLDIPERVSEGTTTLTR